MADAPKAPAASVKAFDAAGNRILVPVDKVDELVDLGGRVASDQEIAQTRLDEQYAQKSTAEKATGIAGNVGAALTGNVLALGGATGAHPALDAYNQGVTSGLSAGTYEGLVRQAVTSLAGKQAGAAFEQHSRDLGTAYSGAHTAGEMMGMLGGAALGGEAGAASKFLPGAGISALGNATEQLVARGLASTAARGVGGRAIATAAGMGAQGLVEGALYGAAQQFGENMLGDAENVGDKVFAATGMGALYGALGGAAIGGAGSLAKSGVVAAAKGVGSGIAKMGEAFEAKAAAKAAAEEGAEVGYRKAARAVEAGSEPSAVAKAWDAGKDVATQKGWAYEQAFKAAAGGMGHSPTRPMKLAARQFESVEKDLGEIIVRHGIIDVTDSAGAAFMNGKAANMVPKAQAAEEMVGRRIGELTAASGAAVPAAKIDAIIDKVAKPYEGLAGRRSIGSSVREYGDELRDVLGLHAGKGEVTVQSLLEQRKALDQLVYQETKALDPKARVQALRDVRAGLEDAITGAMDSASGKAGGELATEYKALKRDFMGLRIVNEVLEDSAARQTKAATFGMSSLIGGAATGGLGTGLIAATGIKLAKDRGNAAAAVMLYRMAEQGSITRAMMAVDSQIGRSAKGLLEPVASSGGSTARDPIKVARRATEQISSLTSRPEAVAERATTLTEGMTQVAPNVAGKVATNMTRALAFLNSKMPPNPQTDPLAPGRKRSWTQTDAERFARYVEAAENPMGVLQDFERGKVTPEAVETLRVLTPTLYRDLQIKTLDAIAEQLSAGKPVSFESRLKVGTLLGIQADPSLNPRVRDWLQGNIAGAAAAAGGSMQPAPSGPVSKPIQLKTQYSAFDRLAEGPGKR